ncbi:hypothetical protein [Mesorhizobium sp.]|uniref:COG3904 family protein n=1 Tax=Mesorhizobium sp. TaxID=1871066 RepID=UPI000FE3EAA1|nr:hypothetical protein [Mesorhizobium sp.]RWG79274.1 MAG: hypothetical protein EOQ70_29180 [Mesorhizobium sp.]RWG83581.1 MAG: hypothetical protein EOQ69_13680 [Mesorhizobium sp.]RWJ98130.1 MAG: hypothetical protein EOR42_27745 [Mesorhizobium sp.]RWK02992.1 MAG: hypothetical protein EOR39_30355 [Mesorhizobium sp.]RWK14087.1 MAG: hypothetical protein EOR41_29525 [Mesorhizobium sp.]
MKTFAWTLVLVLLAIGGAIAQTAPEPVILEHAPPMGFIVVRSSTPGCEPTCPEWISAQGYIEAGTPALLKALLKKLGHRKLPLVLNSQGGETEAAMALGHMICTGGLDTMVAKTVFSECAPDAKACGPDDLHFGVANPIGAVCSSACAMVLASGVRRLADSRAFVGIHRIMLPTIKKIGGNKTIVLVRVPEWYERKIDRYFTEMNGGSWILSAMQKTPDDSIRYLMTYELLDLNLINEFGHADTHTSIDICKTRPPADNCRTVRQ